ncbi:G-rich sequence factor 1 [Brachyistius frenatus]|uniref:G-rich sequence factor 1 n=1 Tax=Brachyistius frenatus TaxID=100188 RepID=UPI0037E78593
MSCNSKSVLFLLQRCVAVRQLTLPTAIKTRGSVSSGRCGFIQQRTWTSTTRTVGLRTLFQLQAAVTSSQQRFCTKAGAPYEYEYPPLPAYQPDSEPEAKEVYVVQVKGLLWSCSAQDLLQFFSDCRIRDGVKGVHLTMDWLGRPSGRAFIEMEHEEDVSKALEKHRQYLGPRYVEVFEVSNSDAEALLKSAVQPAAEDGVVKLRGLPFSCTEVDILHFFTGLTVVENGVTIVTNARGRKSGEAFVQFSSQEAANEALQRDRELIGSRYIEVFPSRRDDIYSSQKRRASSAPSPNSALSANGRNVSASPTNHKTMSPQSSAVLSHFIHMRGLPFQVSGEDIVKFFSPLVVSRILIECGPDGKPSGEADVHFSCHQDAVSAMSRDRMNIDQRYIELFLNSVPDADGR